MIEKNCKVCMHFVESPKFKDKCDLTNKYIEMPTINICAKFISKDNFIDVKTECLNCVYRSDNPRVLREIGCVKHSICIDIRIERNCHNCSKFHSSHERYWDNYRENYNDIQDLHEKCYKTCRGCGKNHIYWKANENVPILEVKDRIKFLLEELK